MPMSNSKPITPPVRKPYRTPLGEFIARNKETSELYKLEQRRNEAIMVAAVELGKVLKLEDRWREIMPEALLDILENFDRRAAYLAAKTFCERHPEIAAELEPRTKTILEPVTYDLTAEETAILKTAGTLPGQQHEYVAAEELTEQETATLREARNLKNNKRYAYRAVVVPRPRGLQGNHRASLQRGYGIGLAHEDESEYTPMTQFGTFDTYQQASDAAHSLNQKAGISDDDAACIIASSIAAQNKARGGRRP